LDLFTNTAFLDAVRRMLLCRILLVYKKYN